MRITNTEALINHGNKLGRDHALQILSAGFDLVDPYIGVKRLISLDKGKLIFNGPDFELAGDPRAGVSEYNLENYERVIVIGAAKGIQRAALALEEILGDYLTGGHVIGKHGDDIICEKIGVTLAGHPTPDKYCIEGCKEIFNWVENIGPKDFVITIAGSGISSLMTWPIEGLSIEEMHDLTHLLQIERGALTHDLNPVRNHLDRFKGGRISRYLKKATVVNLVTMDMGGQGAAGPGTRNNYQQMLKKNIFLAFLSDGSTFQDAVNTLHKYDVWGMYPQFIRDYFLKADPKEETVKYDEYETFNARVFGLTPKLKTVYPAMYKKARELGYTPLMLTESIIAEAKDAGIILSAIAQNIQNMNEPVKAPCALISSGELVVTVGKETGIGGRNQEFCTRAALSIAGSERIVVAAADTDGTDGPGGLSIPGAPGCLAGAVVDGFTVEEANAKGIDLKKALKTHGVSEALWSLNSGIAANQSISVLDLRVLLIT